MRPSGTRRAAAAALAPSWRPTHAQIRFDVRGPTPSIVFNHQKHSRYSGKIIIKLTDRRRDEWNTWMRAQSVGSGLLKLQDKASLRGWTPAGAKCAVASGPNYRKYVAMTVLCQISSCSSHLMIPRKQPLKPLSLISRMEGGVASVKIARTNRRDGRSSGTRTQSPILGTNDTVGGRCCTDRSQSLITNCCAGQYGQQAVWRQLSRNISEGSRQRLLRGHWEVTSA